jgi:hypothetical protein
VPKRLPELLTDHELVSFYDVWPARDPTRMIMIKLLISTGLIKSFRPVSAMRRSVLSRFRSRRPSFIGEALSMEKFS